MQIMPSDLWLIVEVIILPVTEEFYIPPIFISSQKWRENLHMLVSLAHDFKDRVQINY